MSRRTNRLVGGAVACALGILAGCQQVPCTVDLSYQQAADPCDGPLPNQVRVTVEVYNANNAVRSTRLAAIPGQTVINVNFPNGAGQPQRWRIVDITRPNRTPVCENPQMTCPAGRECVNTAQGIRFAAVGQPIMQAIRCECR